MEWWFGSSHFFWSLVSEDEMIFFSYVISEKKVRNTLRVMEKKNYGIIEIHVQQKMMSCSDEEWAIRDLMSKVYKCWVMDFILKRSSFDDKNINGRVERATQMIENRSRSLKLSVTRYLRNLSVRYSMITCSMIWEYGDQTIHEELKGLSYSDLIFVSSKRLEDLWA